MAVVSFSRASKETPIINITNPESNRIYSAKKFADGCNGDIYEALTPEGEFVAIKLSRIKEEAEILQTLKEVPHIPQYREHFSFNGRTAIVMELLPKDTFDTFFDAHTGMHFSIDHLMQMASQVLATLQILHSEKHLVHRDIKPENLFFIENSNTYLGDFGSCRKLEEMKPMEFLSPFRYLSPELALYESYGERFDESVDLWALGTSLFELYTRNPLFVSNNHQGLINDYLHLLVLNFGMPSTLFIESLSMSQRALFKKTGNSYSLKNPMINPECLRYSDAMKELVAPNPRKPVWEAIVVKAAEIKGETEAQAEKVITVLRELFNYKRRQSYLIIHDFNKREKITAAGCLQRLPTVTIGEIKEN